MKIAEVGRGPSRLLAAESLSDNELGALVHQWRQIEIDCGVELSQSTLNGKVQDPTTEIVYGAVFPFVSRTGLILSGSDLQITASFYIGDFEYLFSYREWGAYMAEAVSIYIHAHTLGYLDFYSMDYTCLKFPDYPVYLQNLGKLIAQKAAGA